MFNPETIHAVHLELSSRCNARCPMCPRTIQGGKPNPNLQLNELSLGDIERLFTDPLVSRLEDITLCGSYGEPVMARDFAEIVSFFAGKCPAARIRIETNGSLRTTEWWRRLGRTLAARTHLVSFGLDGLADTHALYRRGTSYEKILENAGAFISAGGKARWTFLVFRHNEHQVEEARALALRMGFSSFVAKKTARFFSASYKLKPRYAVHDENDEVEYHLEPPSRPEFVNDCVEAAGAIAARHGTFEAYLNDTPIQCESVRQRRLYISANGIVLPCSFLYHQLFDRDFTYGETQGQTANLIELAEVDSRKHSLGEIVASGSFQRVARSWAEPSIREGRLKVCAMNCGKEFDKVGSQFRGLYGI